VLHSVIHNIKCKPESCHNPTSFWMPGPNGVDLCIGWFHKTPCQTSQNSSSTCVNLQLCFLFICIRVNFLQVFTGFSSQFKLSWVVHSIVFFPSGTCAWLLWNDNCNLLLLVSPLAAHCKTCIQLAFPHMQAVESMDQDKTNMTIVERRLECKAD